MKKNSARIVFWAVVWLMANPGQAHAYLDPGTGSMLLSALIGIVATGFFMLKAGYYKGASLLYRLRGVRAPRTSGGGIVIYSEGRQYWNSFAPLVQALEKRGIPLLYLSSDPEDPGLAAGGTATQTRHIGAGNKAYATLSLLEADICVLTTPGLDVLQIRRSPGVRHYSHLVHSLTDMAFYKTYSFDYFDSVLIAGPHQMRSLRHLETLRGTAQKLLLETGCLYMDVLAEQREHDTYQRIQRQAPPPGPSPTGLPRVLVAPTWGQNSLLNRFGLSILEPLACAGYPLTVRPHPQSAIAEPELLATLRNALAPYPQVSWDTEASPFSAMNTADVLLSDLSGIVFDFSLVFEKPVITVAFNPDVRGQEAMDLPWAAWELELLPQLGARVSPEDIHTLPHCIAALPEHAQFARQMRTLRERSLFNYRQGGEAAAEHLCAIGEALHRQTG